MGSQSFNFKCKPVERWRIWACLICSLISLLVQSAGFLSTGWIYLKGDVYTIHAGLWYRVTCKKGEDCSITTMINNKDMLEYQIETSIALAACIASIASTVVHLRRRQSRNLITLLVFGMLASMLSGLLAITAAGKMGHKYLQHHDEQVGNYGKSVYKTPYSAFVSGVGGLFACFVTFGFLLEAHITSKQADTQLFSTRNQIQRYTIATEAVLIEDPDTDKNFAKENSHVSRGLSNSVSTNEIKMLRTVDETTLKPAHLFYTKTSHDISKRLPSSVSSNDIKTFDCLDEITSRVPQCRTITSQGVSRRLPINKSSDKADQTQCAEGMVTKGERKKEYTGPVVTTAFCPETVLNFKNQLNPILGDQKSLEEISNAKDLCGHAVLQSGQHIVVNDIYNL